MIVVSNTTPLHYLILIDAEHILENLYQNVIVPQAVIDELQHNATPQKVRDWIDRLPVWLEVRKAFTIDDSLKLGAGEKEAIALTQELQADYVILDDRKARREASALGLTVTGTLNILELAGQRALINLPQAIDDLRQTTFRVSDKLLDEVKERNQ